MAWNDGLSDEQREPIETPVRNAAVVAGPGTGKTRTLLAKALRLIEEEGFSPDDIRIVNFTNAGVRDLREKITEKEMYAALSPGMVQTFHGLALSALLKVRSSSIPNPLVILNDWEEETFVDRFVKSQLSLPNVTKARSRRRDYDARWCIARIEVDDWLDREGRAEYEQVYRTLKDLLGFATRGELTFLWWRFLHSSGATDLRETGLDATVLLVDEYQDLNECEHEILRYLADLGAKIFAVGDPNQSIYEGLRHAHPELCWSFPERLPESALWVLDETHRCPSAVLEMARAAIGEVEGVPSRSLAANSGLAEILGFSSETAEVRGIVSLISDIRSSDPQATFMIPVPQRAIAGPLLQALSEVEIPVDDRTTATESLTPEARLAKALFKLLRDDRDSVAAATAVVLFSPRTTRESRAVELINLAYSGGLPVASLVTGTQQIDGPLGRSVEKTRDALAELQNAGDEILERLIAISGCDPANIAAGETDAEVDEPEEDDGGADLQAGTVTVVTTFSSKGLEADYVFLPACESTFLESNAVGARKEERRRVFFVGITRAMKGTFISFARRRRGVARHRAPGNAGQFGGVSSFVQDIIDRLHVEPRDGTVGVTVKSSGGGS